MISDESGWSVRPLAAAIYRQAKRWRTGLQAQLLEDLVDQRLLQDLRNDPQLDARLTAGCARKRERILDPLARSGSE
jgi:hypothetical protein